MLLIKHNGFYVIQNNKNQYYTILENGKPDVTNTLQNAYKWRRKDRAENYLSNIIKNSDYQVQLVDDEHKRVNKQLIDDIDINLQTDIHYSDLEQWISLLSEITDGFTQINEALIQATNDKKRIEKTITDLRHFIEFGEFNAYQGFRLFRILQKLLRQRRSSKDVIFVLENIAENSNDINYIYWCCTQLKCRNYRPRILKNMFNNYT